MSSEPAEASHSEEGGGRWISLTASDGHDFDAWLEEPPGGCRFGIVVLQEIFGVNSHIRQCCHRLTALGAGTIAPALFDRARRGVQLGYEDDDIGTGRELRSTIAWTESVCDVAAAITAARRYGPVGVVGFCWGGTLAFLAAARIDGLACAVSYYGGQTVPFAHEQLRAPLLMHFGEYDPRIPATDRKIILEGNPGILWHLYPADHGFNCDQRKEWHEPSADIAMQRTADFLTEHCGGARVTEQDTRKGR